MCYMLFKPFMGVLKYVWGSFFTFYKAFYSYVGLARALVFCLEPFWSDGCLARVLQSQRLSGKNLIRTTVIC